MLLSHIALLFTLSICATSLRQTHQDDDILAFPESEIIKRDVVIIGGGSSGTHAAISLKDKGYTTIVLEKEKRIGGHTETYVDPDTGISIDIGVVIFPDADVVTKYFSRFNVTLTRNISTIHPSTFELQSGKSFSPYYYAPGQVAEALQKYVDVISQWPKLDNGMFLPEPVPEDLIMPLGHFVKKYNIEAILPTFSQINPGLGDLASVPVVENLRVAGLSLMRSLSSGFLTTSRHHNSELYEKAQAELLVDGSLLLNARVISTKRSENNGVRLVVETSQGSRLVIAKKLLITVPPKISLMKAFDLNDHEEDVFSRFINPGYYTSVVSDTGIPTNLSIYNGDPNTPFSLPQLPCVYSIQETRVPGLHVAYYGASRSSLSSPINDETVKTAIINSLKMLQSSNPDTFTRTEPKFKAYSSHSPFYLQANPIDIRNGFYKSLYALQGRRNTFWTGAAWRAHDSSSLWRFNEQIVLPRLIDSMQ